MSAEFKAVAAAALGSTLVGTVPMFAVGLYGDGLDVVSLLFWRYGIALAVLGPLALATSPNLAQDWRRAGRGLYVNALLLGALQTYTYFRAVETMPSSIVVTIFFTYPILTLAIDRWVYGQVAGWGSVAAVALVFVGALAAGWPSLSFGAGDRIGLACAIATPIVFSVYMGIAYRFTRQSSPFAGAAAIYLGLATTYTIAVAVLGLKAPSSASGWLALLAIGLLGGVVQISSFAYALPRLSASGYSIIVSLELVTVVLLGVVMLGERLSPIQAAGVALVVGGIVTDRIFRALAAARGG